MQLCVAWTAGRGLNREVSFILSALMERFYCGLYVDVRCTYKWQLYLKRVSGLERRPCHKTNLKAILEQCTILVFCLTLSHVGTLTYDTFVLFPSSCKVLLCAHCHP